ncbi:MAG: hypothetical protein R2823_05835 [Acidimicrobiia bacterium]
MSPIEPSPTGVLQVCHPDWRGVRAAAEAFGDPVLVASNLTALTDPMVTMANPPAMVVVQGWPPGAASFVRAIHARGIPAAAVFHSSPAQHGIDGGEAAAVADMLELARSGSLARVGTVKAGVEGAFRSLGFDVWHVPNRVPVVPDTVPAPVPDGTNAGIFLAPIWRKNVTTQVLAVMRNGWRPHVMELPDVRYLPADAVTSWGEMGRDGLLAAQAAMDIAFNVTLSECHPMMPMEAYRLGVPCLMSRTSDLFASNADLYEATTVAEVDNIDAVALAADRLLAAREQIVIAANAELDRIDETGRTRWMEFTNRG